MERGYSCPQVQKENQKARNDPISIDGKSGNFLTDVTRGQEYPRSEPVACIRRLNSLRHRIALLIGEIGVQNTP